MATISAPTRPAQRRSAPTRSDLQEADLEGRPQSPTTLNWGNSAPLALAAFGHVDVWVNNAGRGMTKPVLELTDDELDLMMSVNVKSALYGMQAIVPHFKERGRGQVINVSSFLSRVPFATFRSPYNAAKAALNALTANARVDLARTHPGIHVTLVMPGLVATDFQRNAIGGTPALPPGTDSLSSGSKRNRTASPSSRSTARR